MNISVWIGQAKALIIVHGYFLAINGEVNQNLEWPGGVQCLPNVRVQTLICAFDAAVNYAS